MDLVLLFPGQGSQQPGMGADLSAAFSEAREVFGEADASLGFALSALCFNGPADDLTRTHNAQPALLTHGAAAWAVLRSRTNAVVRAAAGHSLGEFTAYSAAGSLALGDAVAVVRRRGELMFDAGQRRAGAMAAILGDLQANVDGLCAQASGGDGVVVAANYNSAQQVVISGDVVAVERAMTLAREAGAKPVVRLNVSGAFHSPLMEPAANGLRDVLDATPFRDPAFPVSLNVTAMPCTSAAEARGLLVRQLMSPVRWLQTLEQLAQRFPDAVFVELGPGNVLTTLSKRIAPNIASVSCGTARDVDAFLERAA